MQARNLCLRSARSARREGIGMHLLLTIRCDTAQIRYEFLLRDAEQGRVLAMAQQEVSGADRSQLDEHLEAARSIIEANDRGDRLEVVACLAAIGSLLGNVFLPLPVAAALSSPFDDGTTLIIETDECRAPWELAMVRGMPLHLRFATARRELTTAQRMTSPLMGMRRLSTPPAPARRALVVTDPEGKAASWAREALAVAHTLEHRVALQVEVLEGVRATVEAVASRLESGDYAAVHLAIEHEFNATNPHYSIIRLADGPLTALRLCESGRPLQVGLVCLPMTAAGGLSTRGLIGASSGWGRLFLDLGAEVVVASPLGPRPTDASRVVQAFYEQLGRGVCVAEALRLTRVAVEGDPATGVMVAHGNPRFILPGPAVRAGDATGRRNTEGWVLGARFALRVTQGPAAGRTIPLLPKTMLQGRRILIGSVGERANDIDLGDARQGNAEACLEYDRGRYVLHNQSGATTTRLNGGQVSSPQGLAPGDVVDIGESRFVLEATSTSPSSQPPHRAAPERRFSLHVLDPEGSRSVAVHPLTDAPALLGRLPECALTFDEPAVSRRHALIFPRTDGWYVRQEGSNPIVINGVVLLNERRLEHGDEIQLAPSTLVRFVDVSQEVF